MADEQICFSRFCNFGMLLKRCFYCLDEDYFDVFCDRMNDILCDFVYFSYQRKHKFSRSRRRVVFK